MLPNLIEYERPTSVTAALRLLARNRIRTVPLAGGTALIPSHDASIESVVDLSALNLGGIERHAEQPSIGAMTTVQSIASDPTLEGLAGGILVEAARLCLPRNIRNAATIGGTVVTGCSSCDLLVTLLALDASVTVHAKRKRTLALDVLLSAPGTHLAGGIVTSVTVPAPSGPCGASLIRVARTPSDSAIVNAAALVVTDGSVCTRLRIAIGGAAGRAMRAASLEQVLEGHAWEDTRIARATEEYALALEPPEDSRGSSEYRRAMAVLVLRRALAQAWTRAK